MARREDVSVAFNISIERNAKGALSVTTVRFVKELEKVNHLWTARQANEWIRYYQPFFLDMTNDDYNECKEYCLRNMGFVR